MDAVIQALSDFFGKYIVALAILLIAAMYAVWKLSAAFHSMRNKVKRIDNMPCEEHKEKLDRVVVTETKVASLPCGEHMEQIRKHDQEHTSIVERLSSIDTTLTFMQKSIDGLAEVLQKGNMKPNTSFTQTHSPLSITDLGYGMANRLGVREMFDNNWYRIEPLIKNGAGSRNPYDIQQFCIQQAVVFPEKFLSEEDLDKVKLDAYNTGEPLMSYMKVIAVMARDRYFQENGVDVMEVDAHDPMKQRNMNNP